MKTKPEILTHPHIPQPLHSVNPRSIMGDKWWNKIRQEVYASTDYHCVACGVHKKNAKKHQWLEAHEFWKIDYQTGICEITSIEPLCHYCHNFIHSGRLSMVIGKEVAKLEVKAMLEHGFEILASHNLACFGFTLYFATVLDCDTKGVQASKMEVNPALKWQDWTLFWEGNAYKSPFESYEAWKAHYRLV